MHQTGLLCSCGPLISPSTIAVKRVHLAVRGRFTRRVLNPTQCTYKLLHNFRSNLIGPLILPQFDSCSCSKEKPLRKQPTGTRQQTLVHTSCTVKKTSCGLFHAIRGTPHFRSSFYVHVRICVRVNICICTDTFSIYTYLPKHTYMKYMHSYICIYVCAYTHNCTFICPEDNESLGHTP